MKKYNISYIFHTLIQIKITNIIFVYLCNFNHIEPGLESEIWYCLWNFKKFDDSRKAVGLVLEEQLKSVSLHYV